MKHSRTINKWIKWLVGIACIMYLMSGFYLVSTNQLGVKRRFGKVVNSRVTPGWHYRLPYPIERVDLIKAREKKRISVGFQFADQAAGRASNPTEGEFLSGDNNIIRMEMLLQYSILEPVDYLFSVREPSSLIEGLAKSALSEIVAQMKVDEIFIGSGKVAIQKLVLDKTQHQLNTLLQGKHWIQLSSINLQNVFPPLEVADAFKDVATARQDRDRYVNEAQGYQHEKIPWARGEAEKNLRESEAYRVEKINMASGEAKRFSKMCKEFKGNEEATYSRLFLETMEKTMPKMQKVIVNSGSREKPFNLKIIDLDQ